MLDWIQATQGMKITSRFLSNSNRLRAEILKAYTVPNVVFRNLASRNKKYIVQHLYYTVYLKPKTDGKFFHILNLHCTVQYNIYIFFFLGPQILVSVSKRLFRESRYSTKHLYLC